MAKAVIWVVTCWVVLARCQRLREYATAAPHNQGVCVGRPCSTVRCLRATYQHCVVVLGNLQLTIMERTRPKDFVNVSFPNLREVTGFVVVYRVSGLTSLGQLFPNLARVRGHQLLYNYALLVHDCKSLREVGLYGLLKIDRGGVIVWGVPLACFVESVDWRHLAPRSRHVINPQSALAHCNFPCTCTDNPTYNHCWNNKKCQVYLEGPEASACHEQCLGCRKTDARACSLCKHYTHHGDCVQHCPAHTIVLPDSQYCISRAECEDLTGFVWNQTCLFDCPIDFVKENGTEGYTCRYCEDCDKSCGEVFLQSVSSIQAAGHCVYVNGSLTIHVRAVTEAMHELRTFLSRIQEVYDYVYIYGSLTITSLDFLSSLQRIRGRNLKKGRYSLVINDMTNLQTLFTKNVTENLIIDRGTLQMVDNPMLCTRHIDNLQTRFREKPDLDLDLPVGKNGYSGGCEEVTVGVQIRMVNETTAIIMFSTENLDAHYTVLYVRVPTRVEEAVVPETCSYTDWNAVEAEYSYGNVFAVAQLTALRPASVYVACVESFDPYHNKLGRSMMYNFTTPIGTPEPPFITELTANHSEAVVIHWVDHLDYKPHLTRYELDVSLVEIHERDVLVKDQCEHEEAHEPEPSQHAVVLRPPPQYARGCHSLCGVLASVTAGAMLEEHFDICSAINCDVEEPRLSGNTYFGNYVRTLVLDLDAPKDTYQIAGLAPYRDYRFRLRACTPQHCSRSVRSVVRTLPATNADIPRIKYATVTSSNRFTVKWDPPRYTNGPILSYHVEVSAKSKSGSVSQVWCVPARQTYSAGKLVRANKYFIRVCTRSMAFDRACSEFESIAPFTEFTPSLLWMGVIFGVLICTASVLVGRVWGPRAAGDLVPILELTSTQRSESDPPATMFSDFAYTTPLRESKL